MASLSPRVGLGYVDRVRWAGHGPVTCAHEPVTTTIGLVTDLAVVVRSAGNFVAGAVLADIAPRLAVGVGGSVGVEGLGG